MNSLTKQATIPELPWWPPGHTPLTEARVRPLCAYLRPRMRLAMAEAERRIRARVSEGDIRVHYTTAEGPVGQRIGPSAARTIVLVSTQHGEDTVSVAISCTCAGFFTHQRCSHLAALHAALGWIKPARPEPPAPSAAPSARATPGPMHP